MRLIHFLRIFLPTSKSSCQILKIVSFVSEWGWHLCSHLQPGDLRSAGLVPLLQPVGEAVPRHAAGGPHCRGGGGLPGQLLFMYLMCMCFCVSKPTSSFPRWGRNSSVGSAWARCPQCRGFDPPLGTFSGRGDFSLGVNMGSNSIPPKTPSDESIKRGLVCAHMHFIARTQKILTFMS